jgi:hypothetical protein
MYLSEQLVKKWSPVLEHPELPKVTDSYKRAVTAVILENQERALREDRAFINESAPQNSTDASYVQNWDPILISLVRRAMPNLIAYDIAGVQPMTGPTGLIFAMRAKYASQNGTEALFNEADTDFSARNAAGDSTLGGVDGLGGGQTGTNPALLNDSPAGAYTAQGGMATSTAEALGDTANNSFSEMAFSIEKSTVTAKSRALKAEYTMELAQDLKAIHGLDAETELANILSSEILSEINREIVRTIYIVAEKGASANTGTVNTTTEGVFDLDTDSNGRWSVERFKGLMFQVEREANAIAQRTRRGKGNILITSSDVASALQMAGVLDYAPALNNNLQVDDTGNTFAGILNGRYKVYIDPYSANQAAKQYFVVGYKGSSQYDAGIFYCPYVPLQMVRAVGQDNFQPKIGFKTRYGIQANPFAENSGSGAAVINGAGNINSNRYYRRVQVANIM